jgi:DNA-binding LacI/PurR family transcriptional regulator
MPSLTDVARVAGVSLTTASMVLNKGKQHNRVSAACAERVKEAANKLGYVPNYHARSMKLGRAEVLAVAVDLGFGTPGNDGELEMANPYFATIVAGIEQDLRMRGYLMTAVGPTATARAPDRALLGVRQRRFDGIIVLGSVVQVDKTKFMSEPQDVPVVVIEPHGPTVHATVVFADDAAVEMSVRHLAGLGHRHLLYAADDKPSRHLEVREASFRRICAELGLEHEVVAVPHTGLNVRNQADLRIAGAARMFEEYVRSGKLRATGVLAYNDVMAIGILYALQRAGKSVPGDVSVMGFDDTAAVYSTPRLTTVSHELGEMGRVATELCMQMAGNAEAVERLRGGTTVVQPKLMQGESTGPARKR